MNHFDDSNMFVTFSSKTRGDFEFSSIRLYINILIICLVCLLIESCNGTRPKEEELSSTVNYQLTGSGDETLVFIHGWCINKTYWSEQVNYFKDDYQVLTLDLPGHGKSAAMEQDPTIENYATHVVELLNELNLKDIILIGHSMSGNIILNVYDKMPDKVVGFIGVDNLQELGLEYADEQKQQITDYFDQMENDFPQMVKGYASQTLFSDSTPQSSRRRIIEDIVACDPNMAVATLKSLTEQGAKEKLLAPRLNLPMMLILSDTGQKPLIDKASLDKYAGKGYRIFSVKGTGHYPMIEDPDQFNSKLKEALKELNMGRIFNE